MRTQASQADTKCNNPFVNPDDGFCTMCGKRHYRVTPWGEAKPIKSKRPLPTMMKAEEKTLENEMAEFAKELARLRVEIRKPVTP